MSDMTFNRYFYVCISVTHISILITSGCMKPEEMKKTILEC